jgi:hypothetical protein
MGKQVFTHDVYTVTICIYGYEGKIISFRVAAFRGSVRETQGEDAMRCSLGWEARGWGGPKNSTEILAEKIEKFCFSIPMSFNLKADEIFFIFFALFTSPHQTPITPNG